MTHPVIEMLRFSDRFVCVIRAETPEEIKRIAASLGEKLDIEWCRRMKMADDPDAASEASP